MRRSERLLAARRASCQGSAQYPPMCDASRDPPGGFGQWPVRVDWRRSPVRFPPSDLANLNQERREAHTGKGYLLDYRRSALRLSSSLQWPGAGHSASGAAVRALAPAQLGLARIAFRVLTRSERKYRSQSMSFSSFKSAAASCSVRSSVIARTWDRYQSREVERTHRVLDIDDIHRGEEVDKVVTGAKRR
jgi:hypothetical protein